VQAGYKIAKRQTDDISIVAAVFAIARDADGIVTHARLAFGGVAATPKRARDVEAALLGKPLDADAVEATRAALTQAFAPLSDHRASADYRRALCGNLFAKFVRERLGAEGVA
jgi:xanthine dehydrogenase small subunit